jgi:hypothetical protein
MIDLYVRIELSDRFGRFARSVSSMLAIPSTYLEYISLGLIYTDRPVNFYQVEDKDLIRLLLIGLKKANAEQK